MSLNITYSSVKKRAQTKAIKEITGIDLDHRIASAELKKIVSEKIYNTPQWGLFIDKVDAYIEEEKKGKS